MTPQDIEHSCEDCGGSGSVRVHSPQDYGASFECEGCETCGGTGVDIPVLQTDFRGAVDLLREIGRGDVGFEDLPGDGRVVLRIDRATYDALASAVEHYARLRA